MKTITVVLPTISARAEMLEQVTRAYRERTPGYELQLIIKRDYPNWPSACNAGMAKVTGDYVAFGADDLEPLEGWADAMVACVDRGDIPNPQVWNYVQEGDPWNKADGQPGTLATFTRMPAFTPDTMRAVGPWPEIDYYADNWVSDKARTLGIQTRNTAGYAFVHHWHQEGRLDDGDWQGRNEPLYEAELAKLQQAHLSQTAAKHPPGMIVIPIPDMMRYSEFFLDMLNMLGGGGVSNGTTISLNRSGSVVENLNLSLRDMSPKQEWAWIMNDDHRFDAGLLLQLLEHDVDIVAPLCLRRTPPFSFTCFKEETEFRDEKLDRDYPGYIPYDLPDVPETLFEVVATGGAGMLIRRHVLDTIGFPWFESSDGVYLNEDLEFCRRARAAGFKIHVDPQAHLGHIGQMVIWPAWHEGKLVMKIDHGGPAGHNEVIIGHKLLVEKEEYAEGVAA